MQFRNLLTFIIDDGVYENNDAEYRYNNVGYRADDAG